MKRLVWTLALCIGVAGCAGGSRPATDPPTPVLTGLPTTPRSEAPTGNSAAPSATATAVPKPSSPSIVPPPWPDGVTAHPAATEGTDIGILSYLPRRYPDDDVEWPLLVFLHGSEENGAGTEAELRKLLSPGLGIPSMIAAGTWPTDLPFVVLMPQYSHDDAQHCELADEIQSAIEWADRNFRVDATRVYLTGISCGAIGVWDYLASSPERRVAATVPIAGAPYVGPMQKGGCRIARTPMWVFHGDLDDVVPVRFVKDAVAELHACTDPQPQEITLTTYPDADHDAWSRTYDGSAGHDIYEWLLDQASQPNN